MDFYVTVVIKWYNINKCSHVCMDKIPNNKRFSVVIPIIVVVIIVFVNISEQTCRSTLSQTVISVS